MSLLREPRSASAHTVCEHVRTLGSSGAFNRSGAGPVCGEGDASQSFVGMKFVTPSDEQRLLLEKIAGIGPLLRALSSKLLCIRNPRTGTIRHSHLQLGTLRASCVILWC